MICRIAVVQCSIVFSVTVLLTSCGGGTTQSGGAVDTNTGGVAGIYTGSESLSLTRVADGTIADTEANAVNVTVSGNGMLTLSSGNGSSGQAHVTNNHTFQMRADARTHFSGGCSAGTVILEGRIDVETGITGRYRSKDLTCAGESYSLDGELSADRV